MMINTDFLYSFIARHPYAVVASVNEENRPESALVGIAVTPELEIIFDTVRASRKYKNLLLHPATAVVIGWENEQTLQLEGNARLLSDKQDHHLLETYFTAFPDGRDRIKTMDGLVHFCIKPNWIRFSDFIHHVIKEEYF
ncbi:pyridoxamine 5'-phosphate oxidase [Chitinophaga dinghuensis]|uniref:Pyridoxamine 5'-phosphate oxidase n=1 Tax=Chitinophaga dinghuensis TaxID=1539050 RepID=A0A327VLN3_9BACT|nr:pyridoxamine 5'-phosphate oxidase family protein [Chitinophaga dinghuensis]RAJ73719.1 pyridoxamine 5'-phosphate oxidase [Chitinophaga dinghuensis]